MTTPTRMISFVATTKPAQALEFYSKALGLKLVEDNSFAIVFEVNGAMLRVQKVQELAPARHTVLGWEVPNITAHMKVLIQRGVKFERFPGLPQDESGVWTSPSGARIAWFKDPDGNILSLTQF
jgi:predicted enzyme related to lactoylglutathione lyase